MKDAQSVPTYAYKLFIYVIIDKEKNELKIYMHDMCHYIRPYVYICPWSDDAEYIVEANNVSTEYISDTNGGA